MIYFCIEFLFFCFVPLMLLSFDFLYTWRIAKIQSKRFNVH